MDHHCPWINNCVGHDNHASFIRFLFFVPFGCIHGVVVNANFIYRLLDYQFAFHPHYLNISTGWIFFTVTGISFGAGTALGVIILFLTQLRGVLLNKTQVEDWILEKANHRRRMNKDLATFVYPYNLGCCRNFWQVINFWGTPEGDGINWPVRDDCDKYSFTIEQLEQKKLKKERAVTCKVKKGYSGARCPIFSFGFSTALCLPICAEGRIRVEKGDTMIITRWERKWVYGDKKLSKDDSDAGKQVKGWFPRGCIQPLSIQFSESELPYDSQVSDTQVSTHSDSQYSQLSESDQDSPGKDRRKARNAESGERKHRKTSKVIITDVIKKTKRSPTPSPRQSPRESPRQSPRQSPRESPQQSPRQSPRQSPQPIRKAATVPKGKKEAAGDAKNRTSPVVTRRRKK